MIGWLKRRVMEHLVMVKSAKVLPKDYEDFFTNPMWMCIRHELGKQIDQYYKRMLDPSSGIDAINICRGGIVATEWMMDADQWLKNRITQDQEEYRKGAADEAKLYDLMNMIGKRDGT